MSHFRAKPGSRRKAVPEEQADLPYTPAVPELIPGRLEEVVIASLNDHPDNPNEGDVGAIAESMDANGVYGAVLAQTSTRRILKGHHTVQAAVRMGRSTINVLWQDVDDEHALRILLADNATGEQARRQEDKLVAALAKLSGDPLKGTGYAFHPLAATLPGMVATAKLSLGNLGTAPAELAAREGEDEPDDGEGDGEGTEGDDDSNEGDFCACGHHAFHHTDPDGACTAEDCDCPAFDEGEPEPEEEWSGQLEPSTEADDASVSADGPSADTDADTDSLPAKAPDGRRHPLAIVLDNAGMRRWKHAKELAGMEKARDATAFLYVVEAFIKVMEKAEEEG